MRRLIGLLTIFIVFILSVTGIAGPELPDLKGAWIIKASGHMVLKPGAPHIPDVGPGFHELEIPLVIEEQDGFRFFGYKQVTKEFRKEISGVIGFDNKTIYMTEENAITMGTLVSSDRMECVFLESGKCLSIASREIITRKK